MCAVGLGLLVTLGLGLLVTLGRGLLVTLGLGNLVTTGMGLLVTLLVRVTELTPWDVGIRMGLPSCWLSMVISNDENLWSCCGKSKTLAGFVVGPRSNLDSRTSSLIVFKPASSAKSESEELCLEAVVKVLESSWERPAREFPFRTLRFAPFLQR